MNKEWTEEEMRLALFGNTEISASVSTARVEENPALLIPSIIYKAKSDTKRTTFQFNSTIKKNPLPQSSFPTGRGISMRDTQRNLLRMDAVNAPPLLPQASSLFDVLHGLIRLRLCC
ncbi:hypothetical protein [Pseudomonas lurida]|jgi:hypothetical protein|uniref:hypothetical protein n=1 Tax=Pseudomonas lurida TaxID=244566 RepID=UPI001475A24E|nr:hypothetical protein [Pseudomonas lurida]